jgi:hypothetical protein
MTTFVVYDKKIIYTALSQKQKLHVRIIPSFMRYTGKKGLFGQAITTANRNVRLFASLGMQVNVVNQEHALDGPRFLHETSNLKGHLQPPIEIIEYVELKRGKCVHFHKIKQSFCSLK